MLRDFGIPNVRDRTYNKEDEPMKRALALQLYSRVMAALADPTREDILYLLSKNSDGLSFTQIKKSLKIKNNAVLSHHLNTLQRACLVERTADLSEPRTAEDPYYCYYALTQVGRAIIPELPDAMRKALDAALVSA